MRAAGYEEIEHTADWALRIWAPDLPSLLEQAALGMYELSGVRLAKTARKIVELQFPLQDREALLVDFLSELLYLGESENFAVDGFDLAEKDGNLYAKLEGADISAREKAIKAITFHNLSIEKEGKRLQTEIVFDV